MSTSGLISVDGSSDEDKFYTTDVQRNVIESSGRPLALIENMTSLFTHLPEIDRCFQLDGPRGESKVKRGFDESIIVSIFVGIPHEIYTETFKKFEKNSSKKFTTTFLQEFAGHVPEVTNRLSNIFFIPIAYILHIYSIYI